MITEYHGHSLVTARRLEVRDQGGGRVDSQRGPAPWLADRHLLAVFTQQTEDALVLSPNHKGSDLLMEALPPRPHLNRITSQRPHVRVPSLWELGLQHRRFGGTANTQSITFVGLTC